MRKLRFLFIGVLAVVLIGACSKKAEQKADQTQQQGTVEQSQQTEADGGSAVAGKPVETPVQTPESKPAVTPTEKKHESKPAVQPQENVIKASSDEQKQTIPQAKVVTIPPETPVKVTLVDSIDTDVNTTGNRFRALLAEPIYVDGKMVLEQGTAVTGILDNVVESGRLKTPAEVSFSLVSFTDATGNEIPISTNMISEKKGSHTNRDAEMIGGGALAGAIIGKITGKKGGTAIGAAAGAAAGAGAAAATGKKDIVYHAGTEVTFQLKQPVDVTVRPGTVAGH